MKRLMVTLSNEAVKIWQAYQVEKGIKSRDDALDQLIREFGGSSPEPTPEPEPVPETTKYNIEISQAGQDIIVRSGTKQLASGRDAAALFKVAVDAVPSGGTLGIGEGTFDLSAPYSFALDANGGNIFYCGVIIPGKDMHVHGAGVGKIILKLAPWQRSSSRHVAMVLIRGTGPFAPGYSSFSMEAITFDGNRQYQ